MPFVDVIDLAASKDKRQDLGRVRRRRQGYHEKSAIRVLNRLAGTEASPELDDRPSLYDEAALEGP